MSILIASLHTSQPSFNDVDLYVKVPTLNRRPVVDDSMEYAEKIKTYVLTALSCGFGSMRGMTSPLPTTKEVVNAATKALEHLCIDMTKLVFPAVIYVAFKERTLLNPSHRGARVTRFVWINNPADADSLTGETYFLTYPYKARVTIEKLHHSLASNLLEGNSEQARLFNTDYIHDSERLSEAENLTAMLHGAIDSINTDSLEKEINCSVPDYPTRPFATVFSFD